MDLWICIQVRRDQNNNDLLWAFQGVFDDEEKAKSACVKPGFFIGPAKLNEELPTEIVDWSGAYYPLGVE